MASSLFKEIADRLSFNGAVDVDNWTFKFFSRVSVGLFLAASAASVTTSFVGSPIECKGDPTKYDETYCWLHGTKHLPKTRLSAAISNGETCFSYNGIESDDEKATTYYVWVSLVLFLSAAVFMIPNNLWNHFEGGMLEQFGSSRSNFLSDKEKHAAIFKKLSKNQTKRYFFTFIFFECLNYVLAIVVFVMTDKFLFGKFATYGLDAIAYLRGTATAIESPDGNGKVVVNPMCNLFPTIVSCDFNFYGVTGQTDSRSNICLMGQNIMNQKIYLIIWIWFVVLFTVSGCMILYRVLTFVLPDFQRKSIQMYIQSTDDEAVKALLLDFDHIGNWFLLTQIGRNTDPYKFREFLNEVVGKAKKVNKEKTQKTVTVSEKNPSPSPKDDYEKPSGHDLEKGLMTIQ